MGYFDNLLNSAKNTINDLRVAGYNSDFAKNTNSWLAQNFNQETMPGVSAIAALGKGYTGGATGNLGIDRFAQNDAIKAYQPKSPLDFLSYGTGQAIGTIANPITRGAGILNSLKNQVNGSLFGAGSSMLLNALSGKNITLQNTLEGASQGQKYSWLFPYTNSATDKAMIYAANKFPSVAKYLAPVTEAGITQAKNAMSVAGADGVKSFLPKAASFIAKNVVQHGLQSPLETGVFAGADTVENGGNYFNNYAKRFLPDMGSNLVLGGLTGAAGTIAPGFNAMDNKPEVPLDPVVEPQFEPQMQTPELKTQMQTPELKTQMQAPEPKKIFQTSDEMLNSKEFSKEEDRIANEKKKVAELTQLSPGAVDELYKVTQDPLAIVKEVRAQRNETEPTSLSDILANKKFQVSTEPNAKPDAEMNADFQKSELVKKTGLSDVFVTQKLNEGYSPEKIYSAYSYAKDSPTPVKSMEGYITKSLRTDNFSKPEVKPVKTEDNGYFDSLLQTEPGKQVQPIVEPVKPAVEPIVQPQPEVDKSEITPETYKYDKNTVDSDLETLKKVSNKVETPEGKAQALKFVGAFGNSLDEELKARGVNFSDFVDQVESGNVDPKLQDLAKTTKKFFDTMADVGTTRQNVTPLERQNYFHRVSEDMIANKQDKTAGDVLTASYTKARTGKLTDYIKDPRSLVDYANEAIGNVDKTQQAYIKIANDSKNVYQEEAKDTGLVDMLKKKTKFSITDSIKAKIDSGEIKAPEKKNVYENIKTDGRLFRSIDQLGSEANTDKKFYNDFLWNFKKAQVENGRYMESLINMPEEELVAMAGGKPDNMNKDEALIILTGRNYKEAQAAAINKYFENVKNAEFKDNRLKKLVDNIFEEYVGNDVKVDTKIDKILSAIRGITARGALGLNPMPAYSNLKEINRVSSLVDGDVFKNAIVDAGKHDYTVEYGYNSSKASEAGERIKSERNAISNILSKADKSLMWMFDSSEHEKDNIALAAFVGQGKKKGLSGEDLDKFVMGKQDEYAIKFGKGQDIGLFKNKYVKTILQFVQYSLKDTVIAYDKMMGAIGGDKGDAKYLKKYVAGKVAEAVANKLLLGTAFVGGGTNTFLDMYKNLVEKDESGQKRWIDRTPLSPAMKLLYSYGESALKGDFTTPDEEKTYEQKYRLDQIKKTENLAVPAGGQILNKTLPYLQARADGYYKTINGNVAGPVGTGVLDTVRGTLFGKSYDSKRKEYINNLDKSPSLTKNESSVYKTLSPDKQSEFYADSQAREARKAEIEKMKLGATTTNKPGFFDGLFGNKNAVEFPIPTKDSTPQEKKDFRSDYDTRVNMGYEPKTEETIARYFPDGNAKTRDLKQRVEAFKTIDSVLDNKDMPQIIKDQVMETSGASKEDISYYRSASEAEQTRLQELIPIIDKLDHEQAVELLMKSRKTIADKALVTPNMIDYLYDNNNISKNEKDMLKAIQYDEINEKYYVKKSFANSGKTMTFSKAKSLFNNDIKMGNYKPISTLLNTKRASLGDNGLLDKITGKDGYTPKLSGKKLWFKPY